MNYETFEKVGKRAYEAIQATPSIGLVIAGIGVIAVWQDIGPSFLAMTLILGGGGVYALAGDGGE